MWCLEGLFFSLPPDLKTDPQGRPTLTGWGEQEPSAKETEKEQSVKQEGTRRVWDLKGGRGQQGQILLELKEDEE